MTNKLTDPSQLMYAGKIDKAAIAYRSMLSHNPEDPIALEGLTYCSLTLKHLDEAESLLGRLKEVQPHTPATHWLLSSAAFYRQRLEECEREAHAALELDPDFGQAYHVLGLLLLLKYQNHEAVPLLEKASQLRPEYWQHHYNLGLAYLRIGHYPAAVKSLQRAFNKYPKPVVVWLLIESVFLQYFRLLYFLALLALIPAFSIHDLYSLPFFLFSVIIFLNIGRLYIRSGRKLGRLFIWGTVILLLIYFSRLVWKW